jgi:hypothetical protein
MDTRSLARRAAITGCAVVAGLTLAGGATAAAEQPSSPQPGPVTITLSPEQVAHLCDKRLPRVESRLTKLVERINGGPEVRGSTQWLQERAKKEREAGREASAQLLEERAERRSGRVEELNKVKQWASDFRSQHCTAK